MVESIVYTLFLDEKLFGMTGGEKKTATSACEKPRADDHRLSLSFCRWMIPLHPFYLQSRDLYICCNKQTYMQSENQQVQFPTKPHQLDARHHITITLLSGIIMDSLITSGILILQTGTAHHIFALSGLFGC